MKKVTNIKQKKRNMIKMKKIRRKKGNKNKTHK